MKELIKELEECIYCCQLDAGDSGNNNVDIECAIEALNDLKKAINFTDSSLQLPSVEESIIEMDKIVKNNYQENTEIEKANFRIGWQEHYIWLRNKIT